MVSDLTNKALNITNSEKHGRINEIINEQKETYIQHWKEQTKDQSRLQCYLKLNREYSLADSLDSVRDITHRHLLTKYRKSEHICISSTINVYIMDVFYMYFVLFIY